MPLFEYRCPTCQHDFEVLVRGEERVECPTCRGTRVEKLFSAPAAPTPLPLATGCPPSDAPPCSPHCCRLGR